MRCHVSPRVPAPPRSGNPCVQAHVNFVAWAPRTILEALAAGAVKAATCTIAKVFDQHLNFIALESNLFTLCLPDSYVLLNDNTASEQQVRCAPPPAPLRYLLHSCATPGTLALSPEMPVHPHDAMRSPADRGRNRSPDAQIGAALHSTVQNATQGQETLTHLSEKHVAASSYMLLGALCPSSWVSSPTAPPHAPERLQISSL